MLTIFWIYVVIQCVSTAYGITVINSVKNVPAIRKRLIAEGYSERERNSLYRFNDGFMQFLKGFIPFYYAIKAMKLINSNDPVKNLMDEEIEKGNYIPNDELKELEAEEERMRIESVAPSPELKYENTQKYKAKKIDYEIYDTYETPVEYITRKIDEEEANEANINITPFAPKNVIIKKEIEKETVTKSDIAKAISELDIDDLISLSEKINTLAKIKENNKKIIENDVA